MRSEILAIVAVLGLLPCAGRAQEAPGGVACPSIQNDQERLACYDRSLRGTPHAPTAAAPPAPTVQSPPPAAVAAPVAVGAAAAAATPAPPTAATAPVSVTPSAQATVTPQAAPPVAPPSTVSTAPHNTRGKHASAPSPDAPATINPATGQPTGIMPIVVVSTLVRPGFPIEFTTDKVGVWVQAEVKPLTNLPKAPFNAQLEPGKFGGAFLVVPDRKLGIRVNGPDR